MSLPSHPNVSYQSPRAETLTFLFVIVNPREQYCFAHNHLFEVVFSSSHFVSPTFFSGSLEPEYWGRV